MITAQQIRAGRALIDWSQQDLADAAGVSRPTIKRMESDKGPGTSSAGNVDAVTRALEAGGVSFVDPNGMGAGVRLREPGE